MHGGLFFKCPGLNPLLPLSLSKLKIDFVTMKVKGAIILAAAAAAAVVFGQRTTAPGGATAANPALLDGKFVLGAWLWMAYENGDDTPGNHINLIMYHAGSSGLTSPHAPLLFALLKQQSLIIAWDTRRARFRSVSLFPQRKKQTEVILPLL